ncbi:ABC transporter substrate-binding protein [Acetomicrobium hydrogeniformans]|uniref:ABC transporter, substrate-binding protein, family 5 n=1 Tax=Acetomicrobium hydrogeniformans ATCC BAA-1850 TaxID=592015 RepID=A0A0T5XAG0_9BACT|nr:ABC transporter substrate-binding protein [Acetomicrobium hydrogeniformans]KRT35172.1 ABC transporter, substrate-binding protein, family 5 [Acetomicrobium hydrogeniformans ATCC BAA-1850]
MRRYRGSVGKGPFGVGIFIALIVLFGFFGMIFSESPSMAAEKKVIVQAMNRDPDILDTMKAAWYSDALIYLHDRLVSRDYNFGYRPGLATSWDVSEDGLMWTFHLKKEVKFHDGTPFTAKDVKWTIDTIKDPKTASPFAGDLKAIDQVKIIDDYTVQMTLKYPFPNLLFNLSNTASGIQKAGCYDEYGEDYGIKTVIGTGPFMFKEWVRGDRIVLVKNPHYNWGPEWMSNQGPPLFDELVIRTIPEESSRIMELLTGGVHVLRDVPPLQVDKLKNNPEINIFTEQSTKLGYLAYACDKKPFDDVLVRRAINHAVDRETIVKYIFSGYATPAYGYLPQALKDEYLEESEELGYKYDPAKAKELLAKAGFPDGFETTLSAENDSTSKRLAEVLQAQLAEIGIRAKIQLFDSASYVAMLKAGQQDLFVRLYSWPNADILDWFLLSSQFPYPNHSRWCDPKTDELINSAATAPTWEERAEKYKEVQRYLIEQAVWCPIYIPDMMLAVRKEVKNFKIHPWMIQYSDGIDIETK